MALQVSTQPYYFIQTHISYALKISDYEVDTLGTLQIFSS